MYHRQIIFSSLLCLVSSPALLASSKQGAQGGFYGGLGAGFGHLTSQRTDQIWNTAGVFKNIAEKKKAVARNASFVGFLGYLYLFRHLGLAGEAYANYGRLQDKNTLNNPASNGFQQSELSKSWAFGGNVRVGPKLGKFFAAVMVGIETTPFQQMWRTNVKEYIKSNKWKIGVPVGLSVEGPLGYSIRGRLDYTCSFYGVLKKSSDLENSTFVQNAKSIVLHRIMASVVVPFKS